MIVVPISLREARQFVAEHHRHNEPPVGWLFGAGLEDGGELVAVAIAGRPVGRGLDDGRTVEITRVCTIGHRNAASRLYGALNRAAAALGYERSITYTLTSEPGSSVRAAGYTDPVPLEERTSWASAGRARYDANLWGASVLPDEPRVRWTRRLLPSGRARQEDPMSRPRYALVAHDPKPTLHRFPAFEECNLDDAKVVNRFRTLGQVANIPHEPCQHCKPYEVDESVEPDDGEPVSDEKTKAKRNRSRKRPAAIPDAEPGSHLLDEPKPGGDMWPGPDGYVKPTTEAPTE